MPNTNPSDLDLEALKAALGAWTWQMSYTSGEIEENLQSAVQAYLEALPRASGVPEAEAPHAAMCPDCPPVGYSTDSTRCNLCPRKDAAPPPVAVPSGWKLVPTEATYEMQNAAIDVDSFKLGDISPLGFRISPQKLFAQCYAAMLAAAPPSPIASEPKDAGSVEAEFYLSCLRMIQHEFNMADLHDADPAPESIQFWLDKALKNTRTAPSGVKP